MAFDTAFQYNKQNFEDNHKQAKYFVNVSHNTERRERERKKNQAGEE